MLTRVGTHAGTYEVARFTQVSMNEGAPHMLFCIRITHMRASVITCCGNTCMKGLSAEDALGSCLRRLSGSADLMRMLVPLPLNSNNLHEGLQI